MLAAVDAKLSAKTARIANKVALTDRTDSTAQKYADIGRLLTTGSERNLIRVGKKAVSDAAKEISSVLAA